MHTAIQEKQDDLYKVFLKNLDESDVCILHGNIVTSFEKNHLKKKQILENKSWIEKIDLWKKRSIKNIQSILETDTKSYFSNVVRKDLLAQEILLLFCELGWEKDSVTKMGGLKSASLGYIFDQIKNDIPKLDLPINKVIHIFGYSFDLLYLYPLLIALRDHSNVKLWLVKHRAYPSWILNQKQMDYPTGNYFKPVNQLTYASTTDALAYVFQMLDTTQEGEKIGLVVEDPQQQDWLIKQCEARGGKAALASSCENFHAGIIIGSMSQLCLFSLDTVYVFDLWYKHMPTNFLLHAQEEKVLHGLGIKPLHFYLQQELVGILTAQAGAMYFVFSCQEKVPFLFFHPDEQSDPIPLTRKMNADEDPLLSKHFRHFEKTTLDNHWDPLETSFTPKPTHLDVSPTVLTQLTRCPRQYFYQHVLKSSGEDTQEEVFAQSRKDYGIMIHGFLQNCFQNSLTLEENFEDVFVQEKKISLKNFKNFIPTHYQNIWEKEMDFVFGQLRKYLKDQLESAWQAHEVEYRFTDHGDVFNDLISLEKNQATITWKGQIDRIDQCDTRVRLIDYKTGSFKKKKTDLLEGGLFLQMPLYLYFLSRQDPSKTFSAEIHQIQPTQVSSVAYISQDMLKNHEGELKQILQALIEKMRHQTFLPDPGVGGMHCRSCNFTRLCGPYLPESIDQKGAL